MHAGSVDAQPLQIGRGVSLWRCLLTLASFVSPSAFLLDKRVNLLRIFRIITGSCFRTHFWEASQVGNFDSQSAMAPRNQSSLCHLFNGSQRFNSARSLPPVFVLLAALQLNLDSSYKLETGAGMMLFDSEVLVQSELYKSVLAGVGQNVRLSRLFP